VCGARHRHPRTLPGGRYRELMNRALGLTGPLMLLGRTDAVIE
jgi:hypothetical protein